MELLKEIKKLSKEKFKETRAFIEALIALPESQRLKNIHQTIGAYGSREFKQGSPLNTNRLLHSEQVAEVTWLMGLHSKILNDDLKVCIAVALMHDWGHTPFGHSGEEAAREQEGTRNFDHDPLAAILCSQPHVIKTLEKFNVDPRRVVAALLGPGVLSRQAGLDNLKQELIALGITSDLLVDLEKDRELILQLSGYHTFVQDYCDMIAYVFQDLEHTINPNDPDAIKRVSRLRGIKKKVSTSLRLEDQKLYCSSLKDFRKFLGIYVDYSSKFVLRPQSVCAAAAVREVLKSISAKDFVRATEAEVLEMLPESEQEKFMAGLDTRYQFVAAFRLSPRYQFRGREHELVRVVRDAIGEGYSVTCSTTIDKTFVLSLEGQAVSEFETLRSNLKKRGGQWNKEEKVGDRINIYVSDIGSNSIRIHLLNTPKVIVVREKGEPINQRQVIEQVQRSGACVMAGLLLDEEFH